MSQPLPFFFPVQVHPSPPYTAGPRLHPAWRLGKRDNHHTGRRHVEHGSLVAIKNGCLARNNGGLSRKNGDLTHQNCVLELYHCFFFQEWWRMTPNHLVDHRIFTKELPVQTFSSASGPGRRLRAPSSSKPPRSRPWWVDWHLAWDGYVVKLVFVFFLVTWSNWKVDDQWWLNDG